MMEHFSMQDVKREKDLKKCFRLRSDRPIFIPLNANSWEYFEFVWNWRELESYLGNWFGFVLYCILIPWTLLRWLWAEISVKYELYEATLCSSWLLFLKWAAILRTFFIWFLIRENERDTFFIWYPRISHSQRNLTPSQFHKIPTKLEQKKCSST